MYKRGWIIIDEGLEKQKKKKIANRLKQDDRVPSSIPI